MKLGKILQHMAFGLLFMLGMSGAVVTAEGTAATLPGYASDTPLQNGTIVQLVSKPTTKVKPASRANLTDMYGVTVDPHNLALTVTDGGLQNEAYVANTGAYPVLVSSQDGAIKKGDYVTLSAIDGVAMKAEVKDDMVFGRAQGNFDGKNGAIGTATLKQSNGTEKTVSLGMVTVAVNIQKNPMRIPTKANLPPFLQKLGQEIAQHEVSEIRIYISIFVTGLSIIVALVTLYAGVRNAVISIGRNPLSKKTIYRGLAEVILTSFIILIIGLFAVYLLLKL